jgi:hypothetical protein
MSFPDERRRNDEYGWIEEAAAALLAASRDLVGCGEAARVSDAAVAPSPTARNARSGRSPAAKTRN